MTTIKKKNFEIDKSRILCDLDLLLKIQHQAPVVQTLDSAILRINHYPADKY